MNPKLLVHMTEDELRTIFREEASRKVEPSRSEWLTVDGACDYLKMPKQTLYKLTARRAIPFHRDEKDKRGKIYFNTKELDAWRRGD